MKTQLLNCHSCGNQVSAQAESCPKCGQPFKPARKSSIAGGVFWGLFAFFILLPLGIGMALLFFGGFLSAIEHAGDKYEDSPAQVQAAADRRALASFDNAEERKAQENAEYQEELNRQMAATKAKLESEQALIAAREQADRMAAIAKAQKERADKILAHQMREASNGLPSFQLLLGKRYLTGDGVETNLTLARHWLQSAATNGEPVEKLLSQIK